MSNSLVTSLALLRRRNDATLEVVAYAGQSAPGAGASTFASFGSVSLAPDGKATFVASFAGGGQGLYEQTGTSAPIALAIDGQAAPVFGGGIFALFDTTVARVLDDGSTCFGAVISGGAALYAEFCGSLGNLTAIFDTDQSLPAGAAVRLDVVPPAVRSPFVAFVAQRNGGGASLFVKNVSSSITTKLVADGDPAPGAGGRILFVSDPFGSIPSVNASGEVAFLATTDAGTTAVLFASPLGGLTKIAATGDAAPVGATFGSLTKPLLYPATSLNDGGQVAFPDSSGASAVFLYAPGRGGISARLLPRPTRARPAPTPTGTVRFLDSGVQVGSSTLDGAGRATLSSSLAVGDHSLTAEYVGDLIFASSTSGTVNQTIRVAAFAATSGPMTVAAGQTVSIPLTLYAAAGSGLNFTLLVSGLPANASATFSVNPVSPAAPPAGTTIQLMLVTRAATGGGTLPPEGWPWWWPLVVVALGLAAFLRQIVRPTPLRRRLAAATGLATFLLAVVLVGCSGSGSGGSSFSDSGTGTPKGATTLTVTAVAGSTTVTTDVPIVVQ